MIFQEPEDQNTDKDFDRMLRSLSPSMPQSDEHRQQLRTMLQGRLTRRNRRHRVIFLCTLIITLVFVFNYQTEVGSGGFEVQQSSQEYNGEQVFESVYGDKKFSSEDQNLSVDVKREAFENISAHQAAKQEKLVYVQGWTISDEDIFFGGFQYEIDGAFTEMSRYIMAPDVDKLLHYANFIVTHESAFLDQIENGTARYLGTEQYQFEEATIMFKKWSSTFPEWGEVVYWKSYNID